MEKKEILETLNEKVYRGTKISNIEKAVGLPKNSLASVLTGKKEMPNKWVPKLEAFILNPAIIGHGMPPIPDLWPADLMENIHADKAKRNWLTKDALTIYAFCEKKGFPPSELIEKYEKLEVQLAKMIAHNNLPENKARILTEREGIVDNVSRKGLEIAETEHGKQMADFVLRVTDTPESKNKPNTALKTENAWIPTAIVEKAKEWSGNSAGKDVIDEAGRFFNAANVLRQQENAKKLPKTESKPKELSPFLKSRQNLKNGMK